VPEDKGNRTFKVSPKGIINLAGSTLREIGLSRAKGQKVRVSVQGGEVVISAGGGNDADAVQISPRGVIELPFPAKEALGSRYAVKEQTKKGIVLTRA